MSESIAIETRGEDAGAGSAGPSFGPRLAQAREAMALSVNDIAARLRLHPRQVIAIERENLAALPGPAFVRGFVRNYAKEVRLDAAPLIEALNRMLGPSGGIDAEVQGGSPLVHTAEPERFSRTFVIVGAIGVLIAFAVLGWISSPPPGQVENVAPPVQNAELAPAPGLNSTASAAAESGVPAPAQPASTQPATAAVDASDLPGTTGAKPEATPSAVAPGTLRFGFRETSWVEVRQQDGAVLMSQNNPAGVEQTVRGKPPLRLIIGNASAVSVEFEGKAIDLKPATSAGNVARLTLQ